MSDQTDSLFEMKILNKKDDLRNLLTKIDGFLAHHCKNPALVNKIVMCMDELVTNVISYGYIDKADHEIEISAQVDGVKHEVSITIKDDGVEFDPTNPNKPNTRNSIQNRQIGGLGLHIVSSILDKMVYHRENNMNSLTVTKSLI
jgi:anti-sigma regulatory factor (Ser/Thr protein kinase)